MAGVACLVLVPLAAQGKTRVREVGVRVVDFQFDRPETAPGLREAMERELALDAAFCYLHARRPAWSETGVITLELTLEQGLATRFAMRGGPTSALPRVKACLEQVLRWGEPEKPSGTATLRFAFTFGKPVPISRSRVAVGRPVISGAVPRENVAAVLRRHRVGLRYCHALQLREKGFTRGAIKAKLLLGAFGRVVAFHDMSTRSAGADLTACVRAASRHWRFQYPKSHSLSVVDVTLRFSVAGRPR